MSEMNAERLHHLKELEELKAENERLKSVISDIESVINKKSTLAEHCPDGYVVVEIEYLEDALSDA